MRISSSLSDRIFLALVAVLPIHTVYFRVQVAWKPWLLLLLLVVALDLFGSGGVQWSRRAGIGVAVFLASILASWPANNATPMFWRLWLALVAGCLLMLVVGRHSRSLDRVLRVVFWSAAAMGVTGFIFALVSNGVFGEWAVTAINDIPGINRVNKPAYLDTGLVTLTNWHQDPGYAALWSNVWLVLSVFAWTRGAVRGPRWVGPLVVGGLVTVIVMSFSRTGWVGLTIALAVLVLSHARTGRAALRKAVSVLGLGLTVALVLLGALLITDPRGVGGDMAVALEFRVSFFAILGDIVDPVIDPDAIRDNRLEVWREYWSRFLEQPIRGIGLGTGWAEVGFQEPHNLWLQLLAESGLVGLIGFLVLLLSIGPMPGRVSGSVLSVVGVAALGQTVIFEPVLWFGLGLWLAHSMRRQAEGPPNCGHLRLP